MEMVAKAYTLCLRKQVKKEDAKSKADACACGKAGKRHRQKRPIAINTLVTLAIMFFTLFLVLSTVTGDGSSKSQKVEIWATAPAKYTVGTDIDPGKYVFSTQENTQCKVEVKEAENPTKVDSYVFTKTTLAYVDLAAGDVVRVTSHGTDVTFHIQS